MKVGIFAGGSVADPRAGGGSTFQHAILDALQTTPSSHQFVLFDNDGCAQTFYQKLTVVSLQKFNGKNIVSKIRRRIDRYFAQRIYKTLLNRAAQENQIDLLWFVTPVYQHVETPYLYTVWDLQHRRQPYFPEVSVTGSTYEQREKQYSSVIPRAAYVITGNQAGKQDVIQFYGVPEERVKTIPLPTPPFAIEAQQTQKLDVSKFTTLQPYLFYPAQFWPHKNHVIILHAVKILKELHNLTFNVVFTGSDKGNLNYIQELATTLDLQAHVHFLGFVSQQELVALYQNAFALVFPSFFGPDNIPPLEAFALGCPVIAADVPGAQEQLEQAALLFDPCSTQGLVEKIKQLYQNNDLRNALIDHGKVKAQSVTSDHYVKNIIKIIDQFEPIRSCWSSTDRYKHS